MAYKIAIGPSSFAAKDRTPLTLLEQSGATIVPNPYQRRLTESEIITHLKGVEGLIAGLEPLNEHVLKSAKQLKAIARVGIGMDNVDQIAAQSLGIKVSNTPEAPAKAVAELCLTALLAIQRQVIRFNRDMHEGLWKKHIGMGLMDTKVLLIGYGRIGRRFGELLSYFGAKLYVSDPAIDPDSLKLGEILVPIHEGLTKVKVISLHASGNSGILMKPQFKKMRKGTILLNSARGELVDEGALIESLNAGTISAAWFDAFWKEPYKGELRRFDQVLMTPHVSTYTKQCRLEMEENAVRNLLRDLST